MRETHGRYDHAWPAPYQPLKWQCHACVQRQFRGWRPVAPLEGFAMSSLWLDTHAVQVPHEEPFPTGTHWDSLVVGAGLTGLTTAVLLARSGQRVLVLEARQVGAVATGNTTGKSRCFRVLISQRSALLGPMKFSRPTLMATGKLSLGCCAISRSAALTTNRGLPIPTHTLQRALACWSRSSKPVTRRGSRLSGPKSTNCPMK